MVANVNFDKNFASGIIPTLDEAGDTITYEFSVLHQGGENITNLRLTDTLLGLVSIDLLAAVTAGTVVLSGDDGDNIFESGETWTFSESLTSDIFTYTLTQEDLDSNGTAEPDPILGDQEGQIDNQASLVTRNAAGTIQSNSLETASALLTINPDIDIEKATNGEDADDPTGPIIAVGDAVTWTYVVTNPGNVSLVNVVVTDDNGTPGDTSDDFNPAYVDGDTDGDNELDVDETWTYEASGTAVAGQYGNLADVSGYYAAGDETVTDDDPSHYFGADVQIAILKETNGTDGECPDILVGETVTWTYTVTNPGSVALSNVVVVDDNGTAGDTSDDFNPTFIGGDTDGDSELDTDETWTYETTGSAVLGEYENVATANGAYVVSESVSIDAEEASDDDCYDGVEAGIAIVKTTNGTDNLCPVVEVGSAVIWGYTVTNTGDLAIENVVVVDDNGTAGDTSDDFNPTFIGGDTDGDGALDTDETWTYSANGIAVAGEYENVATVDGTASDEVGNTANVTDSEADCYEGEEPDECVGVGTPGFWANNGAVFWDGVEGNEAKAGKPGFADGELLYAVDSDGDGDIDGDDEKGLLIGDFDGDGLSAGEDTIFIALDDAKALVSGGGGSNGVDKLGRDLVATWLNFQANGEDCIDAPGTGDDDFNPAHYIDEAVNWLQRYASDESSYLVDFAVFDDGTTVKPNAAAWKNDFIGGDHSAAEMHSALDGYNNTGFINGTEFCCDRDEFSVA